MYNSSFGLWLGWGSMVLPEKERLFGRIAVSEFRREG